MEWSNEKVLEFLELFQMEQCLWDPRLKCYKSRTAHSDAWRRILQSLSFEVTADELKKKKESLMGYYRIHLNKYKKSLKTDEVYKTNWFAFDILDSFLRPIYLTNSIMNTEDSTTEENINDETTSPKEFVKNNSVHRNAVSTELSPNNEYESPSPLSINHIKTDKFKQPQQCRKLKSSPEILNVKRQLHESFGCLREISKKKVEMDEYDYFAGMVACKIRKIENMDVREELMNSIHNLIFEFYMKNKPATQNSFTYHNYYNDDTSNEDKLESFPIIVNDEEHTSSMPSTSQNSQEKPQG